MTSAHLMPYFYPFIVGFGYLTTGTDTRRRKIRNFHIIAGLITGVCLYAYLGIFMREYVNIFMILANMGLACVIAYWLYVRHFWSAGDGKLFILFSFLTPSTAYTDIFILPCIVLFVNISILAFFAILLIDFRYFILNFKKIVKIIYKEIRKKLFDSVLIMFSIAWLVRIFVMKLNMPSVLLSTMILYLTYSVIYRVVRNLKAIPVLVILLVGCGLALRLIIQPEALLIPSKFISYLAVVCVISFFFTILNSTISIFNEGVAEKESVAFSFFIFLGAMLIEYPVALFFMSSFASMRRGLPW